MEILIYIISAIILLGLCIFIHELGHLLGGMAVGIKAKVFSMGYGKGIIKKKVGDTTYQVTLIPFGGYCQFYGEEPSEEREGKEYEFLTAAPWKRIVTVAMGPIFNLIFGILIFFMMNLIGYTKETNKIIIPEMHKTSKILLPSQKAGLKNGDRIIKIEGKKIVGFDNIQSSVVFSNGNELNIQVERGKSVLDFKIKPVLSKETGRYSIGVHPYGSRVFIAGLLEDDVAQKSGLKRMDKVISLDDKVIKNSREFINYIKDRANKKVLFKIDRKGEEKKLTITPRINEIYKIGDLSFDSKIIEYNLKDKKVIFDNKPIGSSDSLLTMMKEKKGKKGTIEIGEKKVTGIIKIEKRGFIGVYPVIAPEMIEVKYGIVDGFIQAFIEPYDFIVMNLKGMGMLFSGKMNVRENLSGPIRIAKIAGDVAYYKGIPAFIILMAKISIILMVMNFLPIPVVDGGHLVFFTIEAIRGKPLNQKIMERIQTVGVILLIMLGVFVIINDISMLPAIQKLFK